MGSNIILDKSFSFAIKIVNLYRMLVNNKKEYILSKQLLRSGTSIGANVREGINGSSKADFKNKLNIALKEAKETEYWLQLMLATNIITETEVNDTVGECNEICRILSSIIKKCNDGDWKFRIKNPSIKSMDFYLYIVINYWIRFEIIILLNLEWTNKLSELSLKTKFKKFWKNFNLHCTF